ncbi:uncharacterized protein HaLaN_05327 [Haematococcus lacustris]|uniref:Uncharacterized protein n=1 Tax=Haematococcus lacustris TaxID=44745 RepID=A0A699YIP3_HAELA|nr:uncharacterized protein HaLaN_05327 [Haematococcus lacustris]
MDSCHLALTERPPLSAEWQTWHDKGDTRWPVPCLQPLCTEVHDACLDAASVNGASFVPMSHITTVPAIASFAPVVSGVAGVPAARGYTLVSLSHTYINLLVPGVAGVPAASDITFNRSSGRMQYSGAGLALARAVQGVACGGQVLLSEATAKLVSGNTGKDVARILPVEALRARLAIAHEGEHLLPGVTPALLHAASHFGPGPTPGCQTPLPQPCSEPPARPGMPTHPGPAQAHSEEQVHQLSACSLSAAVNLYSAVSHSLVHRVPLLCGKIRSAWRHSSHGCSEPGSFTAYRYLSLLRCRGSLFSGCP